MYSAQSCGSALLSLHLLSNHSYCTFIIASLCLWDSLSQNYWGNYFQIPAESSCKGSASTSSGPFLGLTAPPMTKNCPLVYSMLISPPNRLGCHQFTFTGFGWQEHLTPPVSDLKKIMSGPGSCWVWWCSAVKLKRFIILNHFHQLLGVQVLKKKVNMPLHKKYAGISGLLQKRQASRGA